MSTEDEVYDVVLASSSYLYAFGKFSRRRNRQTRPQRFWVHDVLRRRDDLGAYASIVQELRLDSDRTVLTASTDTFGCQQSNLTMFWGWWDHTFHATNCVCGCVCRDVRRRQCERRLRGLSYAKPYYVTSRDTDWAPDAWPHTAQRKSIIVIHYRIFIRRSEADRQVMTPTGLWRVAPRHAQRCKSSTQVVPNTPLFEHPHTIARRPTYSIAAVARHTGSLSGPISTKNGKVVGVDDTNHSVQFRFQYF